MGVHGLKTWVANRRSLGTTVVLSESTDSITLTPVILDALAFLFHTALTNTLRGGDYKAYRSTLRSYVVYWRAVGLEPIFIWDGPFDASKAATCSRRSQQRLAGSIAYWRASNEERSKFGVQQKAERLPILLREAVMSELRALHVAVYIAEGEADSSTAEMAQRLGGYAVSNDSDYFIFNATGKGYVPLDTFEYGKRRGPRLDNQKDKPCFLRFTSYRPEATARLLGFPQTFLPIFAALVGNDHSDYADKLVPPSNRSRRPGQRSPNALDRIAGALSSFSRMPVRDQNEVRVVIESVILSLRGRIKPDPDMIAALVQSAFTYAPVPVESKSGTFPLHQCALDSSRQAAARALYMDAFRARQISSVILVILKHGVVDVPSMIENPDIASTSVTLGQPIRLWIYAILSHEIRLQYASMTETVRRQTTLHAVEVPIPALDSLLNSRSTTWKLPKSPLLSASNSIRLSLLLIALDVPEPLQPVLTTYTGYLPLFLALHHIRSHAACPWPPSVFLSAILTCALLLLPALLELQPSSLPPKLTYIQYSTELVTTLLHISILSESLGLSSLVRSGSECFEGSVFHALLDLDEGRIRRLRENLPLDRCAEVDFI